jgi:acetylornithine deacetylase
VAKLLRELIAIPSVNPAFLPPRHPHSGEGRAIDYLTAVAARAGLDIERQKVAAGRYNLIASLMPSGKVRRRILLAPHLDTVNGEQSQFQPQCRGGRVYGRGACDTKGSAAAMLQALCSMAQSGPRLKETEIVFTGLVDEENGQEGSRALARMNIPAELAIVGEPTNLEVVSAHKGSMWITLETQGTAAHGARPDLGKNAVHLMARVVDFLEKDYARLLRKRRHALLGCATVSTGVIRGGTQPNIVPDRCEAQVDRRTLPDENENTVGRELVRLLGRNGLPVRLKAGKIAPCPPMETSTTLPLVQQFLRVAGKKKCRGVDYFCDAAILSASGIPSIVFGPGDIAQAHTADEWISMDSLERAEQTLLTFFRTLT